QARAGQRVTIVSGAGPVRRDAPGVEVKTAPYIDRDRFALGPLRRAWAIRKLLERLSMLPRAFRLLADAHLVHIPKPYDPRPRPQASRPAAGPLPAPAAGAARLPRPRRRVLPRRPAPLPLRVRAPLLLDLQRGHAAPPLRA